MSGRGNRDNGMFNWFRKCVPCFNPAKEMDDRTGRSGDGSGTPRTPRTPRTIIQRSNEERDVAVIEDSKGKGIALNMGGGGGGGGGDVGENIDTSSHLSEGVMSGTTASQRHRFGDVSTAVVQGNAELEDFSQVELGRTATFVGIYDGHGGSKAALFVSRTMTRELMGHIRDTRTMSAHHLTEAFLRTEEAWKKRVVEQFEANNYFAAYGTCCLVGVFWRRKLYLANAGDSRAVIARAKVDSAAEIVAVQLTRDDNVNNPLVKAEVEYLHPDETDFVVKDAEGVFRIKGKIQVSKSIGDEYLKNGKFNLDHIPRFRLNSPVRDKNPALSAEPITYTISIEPRDRFVIFASDGLWENMSNEKAVRIVQEFPRDGIAERLVIEALTTAAKNVRLTYQDLLLVRRDNGERRMAHDDISVVVIFFDHTIDQLAGEIQEAFTQHSIRQGSVSSEGTSKFTALDELVAAEEKSNSTALDKSVGKEKEDMPGLEGGNAVGSSKGGGGNGASSSGG